MKTISKIGVGAIAPALMVAMLATTPASAQSYRDRDRDNTGRDAVLGAVVGGVAGLTLPAPATSVRTGASQADSSSLLKTRAAFWRTENSAVAP